MKVIWAALLLSFSLAASTSHAASCPGAAECPYSSLAELSERPQESPYAPAGVAVDPATHEIFVSDRYANAIKVYGQDGTYLRSWGGRNGGRVDDLDQPAGISFDGEDNLWATAFNQDRVAAFEPDGDALGTFGAGQGAGDGQFLFAQDVAIASDGRIWVTDTGNNRVQALAADGTMLAKYGANGPPTMFGLPAGSGVGEFDDPSGITVAANGDVYVADTGNNRLQRLPAGTTTWEVVPGQQLTAPNDVVAVPDGRLFIAEAGRTLVRDAQGVWSILSTLDGGDQLDVDGGKVFLVQHAARRVRALDATDGSVLSLAHPIEPRNAELRDPQGAAIDADGNVYVADTEADRVVKFAADGTFLTAFGAEGHEDGQLSGPWSVGIDSDGDLLVADTNNGRIQELDATTGAFKAKWTGFQSPMGVAVIGTQLLVAESGGNRVHRSNDARTSWTRIGGREDGETGSGPGEFYFPSDVAASATGDIWVSDPGNDRVQKLANGSQTWQTFGTSGTGDGQFDYPRGIDVNADGSQVVVADTNNNRVQRLTGAGAFDTRWGGTSFDDRPCPGVMSQPWGIAIAPDGSVVVADSTHASVTRYVFGTGSLPACDRTAPTLTPGTPANAAQGVAASPSFTVTGGSAAGDEPAVTIRVLRDTASATRVVRTLRSTTQASGTWTIPWSGPALADGEYAWEAVQRDAAGNASVTHRRTFRVGEIPLAITHLNTHTPVSGSAPGSNPVLEDQTPTFRGTAPAGTTNTIVVHLDRHTGGGNFVPDVHTFTTSRDPHGNWTATPPVSLVPETWRVRVTQGSAESSAWWFQLQALTISHLGDALPVSGSAPGTNPVTTDRTPTFKGIAIARSGAADKVTVHLDQWNGQSFIPDKFTFDATRGPNGHWSATAPEIYPETWRVRVTQVVDGLTRTSDAWYFQLQNAAPPAITALNTGVPVSGTAPGANPVLFDDTPTFSGTASPGTTVTVRLDRHTGGGNFVDNVHTFTTTASATGAWTATAPRLVPETWRVRATEGGQSSAGWYFQVQSDGPLAITHLDTNVPVSGDPPGTNPVLYAVPTLRGTAFRQPGTIEDVKIRFERWTGTEFKDHVTFNATRDAAGNWSLNAAGLSPNTYRVRVTQGDASSPAWFLQFKPSPKLAVTHLDGRQLDGAPPGANPKLTNRRPVFKGTASILPHLPEIVVVRLHKWNGRAFEPDAFDLLAKRDPNSGEWTAQPEQPLPFETYAVQVAQGESNSPEWYFHVAPEDQPPSITIRAPLPNADGNYRFGYSYRADFECTDDAGRPTCDGPTRIDTSREGWHEFKVTSIDSAGKTSTRTVSYFVGPKPASDGIEVQGIELTQGSQTPDVENPETTTKRSGIPITVRAASYKGVKLVRKKRALARVFVHTDRAVWVVLYGYRDGKQIGDGPLFETRPNAGTVDHSDKPMSEKQRIALGAHAFIVPADWMRGKVDLVAVAMPESAPSLVYCATECDQENGFALTGISPVTTRGFDFSMVHFKPSNGDMPSVVEDVQRTLEVLPIPDGSVSIPEKYQGELPFQGGAKYKEMHDALWRWDQGWGADVWWHFTLGVADADTRNIESGSIFQPKKCILGICSQERPVAVVSAQGRPLTAVGHEIAHGLGRGHAGCGDGEKDPFLESWKPDNRGYLQGVGADVSAFERGDFVIYDGIRPVLAGGKAKSDYDHMSYCAPNDDRAWVSPRGWEIMLEKLRNPAQASFAAARRGPVASAAQNGAGKTLAVTSLVSATGEPPITTVTQGTVPTGTAGSPVQAVVRDAAGAPITTVPMSVQPLMTPHQHGPSGLSMISATIPADRAASVTMTAGSAVLATRSRSANAPTLSLTAPRAGTTVGRSKTVEVAWKAADGDGDKLTAKIEYSPDGGRTWRVLSTDQPGASVALRRELFERSRKGLVRVTVNDGWNETVAVSKAFKALGSPPAVAIAAPVEGALASTDSVLSLSGSGQGEGRTRLGGKQLTWFDGKRRLGRGAAVAAHSLPPGTRVIRLVGRDAFGRTGTDTVKVKVRAVAPQFTRFTAPSKVGSRARSVKVRVAASQPSVLKVGKQRIEVSRRAKSVALRIKPGSSDLALAMTLLSYGKTTRSVLRVAR